MDGVCWHVTTPRLLQPCATGLATSWGHEGLRWATLMHTADLWMPSEKVWPLCSQAEFSDLAEFSLGAPIADTALWRRLAACSAI